MSAGPPGYVGELERDVSCTKEQHPRGQLVEFEVGSAREQELLAGNAEVSWLGSGGDHEVPRLEHLAIYRQPLGAHEPRGPMKGRDPRFLERLLPNGRHGIREGPFELHQSGPGDMRVATHSSALHPTVPVRELRGAHEHFLWVTTAQRARPAVRELIYDRDAPARGPAPVRRGRTARPRADDDEIEGLRHGSPGVCMSEAGLLLLVPGVQHLPRLVCEALRIVLRIGAMEFSCVRILQIVWSRRLRTLPAGLSSIQHEDPGAWAAQRKHPVVGVGEDPMPIPVMGCPRVGHELSDLPDVLLAAAVFRCPDDVDPEARIVHGRENSSLSLLRAPQAPAARRARSEEHTSELQSQSNLVCRLLLEKKKKTRRQDRSIDYQ